MTTSLVAEVLGAMITPAVLISAGGTLVLSTSNRLSRVVDRVRVLSIEAERLHPEVDPNGGAVSARDGRKRKLLVGQLRDLSRRALLLRSANASLYLAIGFLISTSIGVGLFTAFGFRYGLLPISLGMLGPTAFRLAAG